MAQSTVDYGAAGFFALLILPTLAAIGKSVAGKATIAKRYGTRTDKTEAAVLAQSLIPELADLVASVVNELAEDVSFDPLPSLSDDPATFALVKERLDRTDYLDRVAKMGALSADVRDLHELPTQAIRWLHIRGWSALAILAGLMYFATTGSLERVPASHPWIDASGILVVVGLLSLCVAWWTETNIHNRLESLIAEYGVRGAR